MNVVDTQCILRRQRGGSCHSKDFVCSQRFLVGLEATVFVLESLDIPNCCDTGARQGSFKDNWGGVSTDSGVVIGRENVIRTLLQSCRCPL
jgi:hypothetical protein